MKKILSMFVFFTFIFHIPFIVNASADCDEGDCGNDNTIQLQETFAHNASEITSIDNINLTETTYGIPLDEAIDIQAMAEAPPITSQYHDSPAYVDRSSVRFIQPTGLYGTTIAVKKTSSSSSETVFRLFGAAKIFIKDIVIGDMTKNSDVWYEIGYQGKQLYIHSSNVLFPMLQIIHETDVYEKSGDESHIYGSLNAGKMVSILGAKNNSFEINYQYWRIPKKKDIENYLQPENNNIFQFVRLDQPTGVSAEQVNTTIEGKGILHEFGQAFIEAAETYEINDAYLIAHSLLETGGGTSPLANGIDVGKNDADELMLVTETNQQELSEIKTTYNMYGIGAADSCPEECGAIRAYELGWFHPKDAIINGAKFVSEQYIYNEFSQNTLYKMKWNPSMKDGNEWKQYATDIGWAEKQTEIIEKIYRQLDDPFMTVDIPVYE